MEQQQQQHVHPFWHTKLLTGGVHDTCGMAHGLSGREESEVGWGGGGACVGTGFALHVARGISTLPSLVLKEKGTPPSRA